MKSNMNAEPLRISAKAKTIAAMIILVGAIFAAAFSVGVFSSLPVKVTPLAGGTEPTTTLKLTNGTPVVKGWNTTKVVMNLTAVRGGTDNDDRIRGIWYRIDTWNISAADWKVGTWVNYTIVNKTVNITTQGTLRINYNASDYLDDETTQIKTIYVDTVAPTSTATITSTETATNGWYKKQVNITLKATNDTDKYVNMSGLNSTTYKIGAAAAVTNYYGYGNQTLIAAGIKINVSAQGITKVNYSSKDNATNEAKYNISIKIDSVAPTLTLPADDATLTDLWFNWTATDASSGIDHYMISVDGAAAVSNTNGSIKLTGGAHNVTVTAIDVAGNSASETVNVTATAPAGGIDMMMIIIIVVVIVVVIALVAVMMMRKGKKGAVAEEAPAAEEKS